MMKSVKPTIEYQAVTALLREELRIDFANLKEVDGGLIARTYALELEGRPYVLQFTAHNMSQGCLNERFFSERFRQMEIPVRNVLYEGDFTGLHYTIAEKVQGKGLNQLPWDEFTAVLPSVMDLLMRIASIDTSDTTGYGWLDVDGTGMFASWRAYLCQIKNEEPGMFYDRWHSLFDSTFLDRKVFDHYFNKMEDLIDQTPSRRELVHGGFGYGNLLVKDGRITAVLDWQDARYGDPVFDLAYMTDWFDGGTQEACINVYKQSLEKFGRQETNLQDRIKCYRYFMGIDGLRFAAKTENQGFYQAVLDKLAVLEGTN
jgi:hygromycin-B 4-O-kinase